MQRILGPLLAAASVAFILISSSLGQANCIGKQIFSEKACAGDAVTAEEKALFELVTKYRSEKGLPPVKLSVGLSLLGNRHLLDLRQNVKSLSHGWSNCPYDIKDEKTWKCVIDAPARLESGYKGSGYETLYRTTTGTASPQLAIEAWKKSTLHNSIILNLDSFDKMVWDEIGVAIDGQYAALWFGSPEGNRSAITSQANGLGVTFDQAVSGLTKMIAIERTSSTVDGGKWQGTSADKKITLEIFGVPKEIAEANLKLSIKLEADGKLSTRNSTAINTLLGNILPTWTDRDDWLGKALRVVGDDQSASRSKIVGKVTVEISRSPGGDVEISVRPYKAGGAKEVL